MIEKTEKKKKTSKNKERWDSECTYSKAVASTLVDAVLGKNSPPNAKTAVLNDRSRGETTMSSGASGCGKLEMCLRRA